MDRGLAYYDLRLSGRQNFRQERLNQLSMDKTKLTFIKKDTSHFANRDLAGKSLKQTFLTLDLITPCEQTEKGCNENDLQFTSQ